MERKRNASGPPSMDERQWTAMRENVEGQSWAKDFSNIPVIINVCHFFVIVCWTVVSHTVSFNFSCQPS